MYFFYSVLLAFIIPFVLPFFLFLSKRGDIRGTLRQRLGLIDFSHLKNNRKTIWIHAASVGEVRTGLELVRVMKTENPTRFQIVMSVVTKTGYTTAAKTDGLAQVFYLPIDIPFIIKKVVNHLNPGMLIIIETELWPNLIKVLNQSGIKIVIANARISEKSLKTYRYFKFFMKQVFGYCDRICVQNEIYKQRYLEIGANAAQLEICGDIKDEQALHLSRKFVPEEVRQIINLPGRIILAAVSTHPGEEEMICEMFLELKKEYKKLFLILAPRHIHRADTVAQLLMKYHINFIRRSHKKMLYRTHEDAILWDTFGELGMVFSVSSIVFVGGSLVRIGGHSLMEPAAFGKPVLWGSFAFNFPQASLKLIEGGGGLCVENISVLTAQVKIFLENSELREKIGRNAYECVIQSKGAVERHLKEIQKMLPDHFDS